MTAAHRTTNVGASVRARLHNVSRRRGVEFQLVLSEFAIERLLYRLGVSAHADRFVLKGAMLLKLWSEERGRATWDLDLHGKGANTVDNVVATMQEICGIRGDDGIVFDPETITGEEMRAPEEYVGVRLRIEASLADARIPVLVDVGFGDAIVPPPVLSEYPTLLDHAPPRILAYPREAIVAEKLEAIISIGLTNSRMKDFYDIEMLASSFAFEGAALAQAIGATFTRRRTPFPESEPLVLTPAFLGAPERQTQWRAFLRRGRLEGTTDAGQLAGALHGFVWPVLDALARGEPFECIWPPGGPWERVL